MTADQTLPTKKKLRKLTVNSMHGAKHKEAGSKKKNTKPAKESTLEEEKRDAIKSPKKSAIENRKDNYEKRPSSKLKKKRGTSDGHMR